MTINSWKYEVIVVGLQPWHTAIGSNCVDIAKVLSTFTRVLYVNRPLDIKTVLKQKATSFFTRNNSKVKNQRSLIEVLPNIWVLETGVVLASINLLSGKLHKILLKRNNRKLADAIEIALRELAFQDFILFNDNDFFHGQYLKEMLKPSIFIYYLRDYLIEQPYFKRNGKLMEAELIKKADFTFTNSNSLLKYASQFNSKVKNIGQGCNHHHLKLDRPVEQPQCIKHKNLKIVGYIGSLVTLRLDLPLLEKMTRSRIDIFWVFIGPMDKYFAKSRMHKFPNVLFTGPITGNELIDYLNHFDVCINPQCLNEMTIGNYPRKLDEYFYFGKPVVARKTEFTLELKELVYQYDNEEEFLQMLDLALLEDIHSPKREKRKKISMGNTWENSVHQIIETITN